MNNNVPHISQNAGLLALALITGCVFAPPAAIGPVPVVYSNPTTVPAANHDFLWDQIVDVVDDYFRVQSEQRVRLVGDVVTEGRIETHYQGGATWLEPQRGDSAGPYNRWESSLQSIRRRASVRAIPAEGSFLVEVNVFKELEDVERPEHATAGAATFRHDRGPKGRYEPVAETSDALPWIPLGRDVALEQQILTQIHARLGGFSPPMPY